jgi:hypothetical protein
MKTLTLGLIIFVIFSLLAYGCSSKSAQQPTPTIPAKPTVPGTTGGAVIDVPDDFVDDNPDLGSITDPNFSTDPIV